MTDTNKHYLRYGGNGYQCARCGAIWHERDGWPADGLCRVAPPPQSAQTPLAQRLAETLVRAGHSPDEAAQLATEAAASIAQEAPADERARFEAWMSDNGAWPKAVERNSKGDYLLSQAGFAWRVWQARAALAKATGSQP